MADIVLHPGQSEVFKDMFVNQTTRFGAVCAARGWGKSYFAAATAMTAVHELMALDASIPNKNVYIIAPTYEQVRDIYWPILAYEMGAEVLSVRSRRDVGRFIFPNNVELRLVSYEAVERLRGKGAYFVVGDEISSWKKGIGPKEAWEGIIQPAIVTRWGRARAAYYGAPSPGRALNISTPKGYNFFYDMYNYQETDSEWASYHYDYTKSPYIDADEIERIKHTIDPIEFASEYMASFEDSGNNVFYCFDRKIHVRKDLDDFAEGENVHAMIDFNVGIMATSIGAIRAGQLHILYEKMGHPDTENLAISLAADYNKEHKVFVYPDPTGNSRKTSAPVGITDFSILRDPTYKFTLLSRKKSPPIVDSVAAVNRKLMTAAGEVSFFIHPRCTNTIKSLERTRWMDNNVNTATIDKSDNIEHHSDGVRYGVEYVWPIRNRKGVIHRGFNF